MAKRIITVEDISTYNFRRMLWCQAIMDKAEDSHVKPASSRPLLSIRNNTRRNPLVLQA